MSTKEKIDSNGMGLAELAGPHGQLWLLLDSRGKTRFWILLAVMIGAAVVELASLAAIQLYAGVLSGRELSSLPYIGGYLGDLSSASDLAWITGGMALILVFKMLVFTLVYWDMASILASERIRLSTRLFKAYQGAPYAWHLQRATSDLQRNLREDVSEVVNGAILPLLQLILSLLTGFAIFAFIVFNLPGVVILGLLLAIIPFMMISGFANYLLVQAGSKLRIETSRSIVSIHQGFGALTEARILDRRSWFLAEFKKAMVGAASAQRVRTFLQQVSPVAVETVLMIAMMIIIAIILQTSSTLEAAMELATILAVAMFRLKQILSMATTAINKISGATPSLRPLIDDLTDLAAYEKTEEWPLDADRMEFDALKFNCVSFTFPTASKPALHDVSFEVTQGKHIAVLGSTGAGKSTLISLVLGLLNPSSGSISVNEQCLSEQIGQWRKEIGYVPQSIYTVDGTIATNIALGVFEHQIDRKRVQTVLEMAGLAEFVESLPHGIDTRSGEHGSWLSGGQRQRVGIARALYDDPKILILDEATSALDKQTEHNILTTLNNFERKLTMLTITHRIETVKDVDTILFLNDGRLAGQGNYSDLFRSCELFRFAVQSETSGRKI